jgi:hypothetical protein
MFCPYTDEDPVDELCSKNRTCKSGYHLIPEARAFSIRYKFQFSKAKKAIAFIFDFDLKRKVGSKVSSLKR